jgi:hypothetical protein
MIHSGRSRRRSLPHIEALDARLLFKTIFVDVNGPAGQGASWAFPLQSLQMALSMAAPGDQIRVADGVYKPTTTSDRGISFELKQSVQLLGGYAGFGGQNPDLRDVDTFQTVLSGEIGSAGTTFDNSYHVVTATSVSSTAILDGFTLTGGYANDSNGGSGGNGGGIYMFGASPSISNCTITNNRANSLGEGIYIGANAPPGVVTAPSFTDCRFINNGARSGGSYGGAIFAESSSPIINDCEFTGNATYIGGGAVHGRNASIRISDSTFTGNWGRYNGSAIGNESGTLVVNDCVFNGNISEYSGTVASRGSSSVAASAVFTDCTFTENIADKGGAFLNDTATLTVNRCTFVRNTATYSGGVLWSWLGKATITDSKFYGNSCTRPFGGTSEGGAITTTSTSPSTRTLLVNCEFVSNRAGRGGAILNLGQYGSDVRHCTFVNNAATVTGGAIEAASTAQPMFVGNSILWNNTAPTGAQIAVTANPPTVLFSNVQGGFTGMGNINADPMFVRNPSPGSDEQWGGADDDYGDLRLQMQSACVDAGGNSYIAPNYPTDMVGAPRAFDFPGVNIPRAVTDMGAHELGMRLGLLRVADNGMLALPAGGYTFIVEQFVFGNGATLDIADASLILLDSSLPAVQSLITQGYNAGDWLGAGITSSAAAADITGLTAIGYADNADLELDSFQGVSLTGAEILLKYTSYGDSDLSGVVDLDDFNLFLAGYQNPANVAQTWVYGQYDYAAAVDLDDFNLFLAAYQA